MKRNITIDNVEYTVSIEKDEGCWYCGQCVQIPGALSQGKTLNELMDNMKEAIGLMTEWQKDKNEKYKDDKLVAAVTERFMQNHNSEGELSDKELIILNSRINFARYLAGKL